MRIPIISTMKSLRPVKRYFASATAARNASTIEAATATITMIRLFLTSSQKYGLLIASRKCDSVGCEREPRRREAVDLVVRLERRRDHPEDGEDEDHEDGAARRAFHAAAAGAGADAGAHAGRGAARPGGRGALCSLRRPPSAPSGGRRGCSSPRRSRASASRSRRRARSSSARSPRCRRRRPSGSSTRRRARRRSAGTAA